MGALLYYGQDPWPAIVEKYSTGLSECSDLFLEYLPEDLKAPALEQLRQMLVRETVPKKAKVMICLILRFFDQSGKLVLLQLKDTHASSEVRALLVASLKE